MIIDHKAIGRYLDYGRVKIGEFRPVIGTRLHERNIVGPPK